MVTEMGHAVCTSLCAESSWCGAAAIWKDYVLMCVTTGAVAPEELTDTDDFDDGPEPTRPKKTAQSEQMSDDSASDEEIALAAEEETEPEKPDSEQEVPEEAALAPPMLVVAGYTPVGEGTAAQSGVDPLVQQSLQGENEILLAENARLESDNASLYDRVQSTSRIASDMKRALQEEEKKTQSAVKSRAAIAQRFGFWILVTVVRLQHAQCMVAAVSAWMLNLQRDKVYDYAEMIELQGQT